MNAFQLAVYERLTRRPAALPQMLDEVGRFLQAMVEFRPSEEKNCLRIIAAEFSKAFRLLPMQHWRCLMKTILREMGDRSDFLATVAQMRKS